MFCLCASGLCVACIHGNQSYLCLSWHHFTGNTLVCAFDSSTWDIIQGFCMLVGLVHDRGLPLCACQGGPKCTCMPGVCCWTLPSRGRLHQEALDTPHDSPVATEQSIAGKQTSPAGQPQAHCCSNATGVCRITGAQLKPTVTA